MIQFKPTLILLFLIPYAIDAQFRGNNLVQYQLGNLPDKEPKDLTSIYSQTNLSYRYKSLRVYSRIEQFNRTDSLPDYFLVSQLGIHYKHKRFNITIGNFNETLGRGLLLRTYDIKGSVLDDRIFKDQKGFYRDLQGVSVNYTGEVFQLKALRGKALNNLYPLYNDDSRTELIEAVNPSIRFLNQQIGVSLLRHYWNNTASHFVSYMMEGNLPINLSYYIEYANALTPESGFLNKFSKTTYSAYAGINYSYKNLGLSLEFKDYSHFIIGSGITNPPTLIKEHNYRLLNRSIHITDLTNESGYQLELFYNFNNYNALTFNTSRGENWLFKTFRYYEYFLEFAFNQHDQLKSKLFIDMAQDQLKQEDMRYAGGVYNDFIFPDYKTISVEFEYQWINRTGFETQNFSNTSNSITYSKDKLAVGVLWETTTDPFLADKPKTIKEENLRNYFGGTINYRFNTTINLTLFAGQRQGGPACSSGVCYEVLDFEGIELRLSTKFN